MPSTPRVRRVVARELARQGIPRVEGPGDPILRRTLIPVGSSGVTVRANDGSAVGPRSQLNFIEGDGINITVVDDSGTPEVDVTISAGGSGSWIDDFPAISAWGRRAVIGVQSALDGIGLLSSNGVSLIGTGFTRDIADNIIWVLAPTGTGAAPAEAGLPAFVSAAQRRLLPLWTSWIRLPQISGSWNFWAGLSDVTAGVNSPQAGVNPNTLNCAGFRFFPSLGSPDTTWFAVSGDAASGQSTDTGITVNLDTTYKLTIDMRTSGHIKYYINDVLAHDETTVLPGNTASMGIVETLRRTLGTTNRTVWVVGDNLRFTT